MEYYSSLLVQLNGILKEKSRGKFIKGVLFLHDNILHLLRVPIFCVFQPSFSLRFFICSTHFAFLVPIFLYFSFPFISFLTPSFFCYLPRPLFSSCLFSLIRFHHCLYTSFVHAVHILFFLSFLFPRWPAGCCRQLSLQGRLATYFCPCKTAHKSGAV